MRRPKEAPETSAVDPKREKKREYQRRWRMANPQKQRAADRRQSYGITQAEFDTRLRAQGGLCAICRVSEATSVDHSHATGCVRAILCRACNAGLGFFRDDPALMRRAAAYLGAVVSA